jgi:hypothetical protein
MWYKYASFFEPETRRLRMDDKNRDQPSWGEVHHAAAKDAGRSIMKYVYIGAAGLIGIVIVWKLLAWWLWSFVPDMPDISLPDMPEISMPDMPKFSLPSWGSDDAGEVADVKEITPCGGYHIGSVCLTDGQ